MRIASLVPSATEALFALGLGDCVVAVTHECDYPPEAAGIPHLTRSVIPEGLSPGEIDRQVREVTQRGEALYRLDEATLAALQPDLIVTQALCAVCAVSFDDVRAVAGRLPKQPAVISLDPSTLAEVFDDMVRLGEACGERLRGERLRDELRSRVEAVKAALSEAPRPRTVALEWLDPPYVGGHWVPEMVTVAGGEDPLGAPGEKSRTVRWDDLRAARPEIAVVMPCGLYADEAAEQATGRRAELESLEAQRIVAVDAASSFSRPGPRLADGVELLAHILHPDHWREPDEAGLGWRELAWGSAAPSTQSV
jgi:iron complex transport system substrate-binding protein